MTTKQLLRKASLSQGCLINYKTISRFNSLWDPFISAIIRDTKRIVFAVKKNEKIAASPYGVFEKGIRNLQKEVSVLYESAKAVQEGIERDYESGVLLDEVLREAGVGLDDKTVEERKVRLKLFYDHAQKAFSTLESLRKFMDVAGYVTDKLPVRIPNIPWLAPEDEDQKYKEIIKDLRKERRKEPELSLNAKEIKEQVKRYNPMEDLFPETTVSSEELRNTAKAIEDYLMGANVASQRSTARKFTLKVLKDLGYEKASEAVSGIFASVKGLAIVKTAAIQDYLKIWKDIATKLEDISESVMKGSLKDAYRNLAKAWSDEKYKANLIALNNFVKGGAGKVGLLEGFADGFTKAIEGNILVAERTLEEAVQSQEFSNEQRKDLSDAVKGTNIALKEHNKKIEEVGKSDVAAIDSYDKLKDVGATDEQITFLRDQTKEELEELVKNLPGTGAKEFVQEYIDKEKVGTESEGEKLYEQTKRIVLELNEQVKEIEDLVAQEADPGKREDLTNQLNLLRNEILKNESAINTYRELLSQEDIDDLLDLSAKVNYKGLSVYAKEPFSIEGLEALKTIKEKAKGIVEEYKTEDETDANKELNDMLKRMLNGIRENYKNKIVRFLQTELDREALILETKEAFQNSLKEFNEIVFKIIDDRTNQLASNLQNLREFFTKDSNIQREFVDDLIKEILAAWERKKKEVLGKVVASSFGFKKLSQTVENNKDQIETVLNELVKEEELTEIFEETFRENLDQYDEKSMVLIEKAKGEGKELIPTSSLFKRLKL